MDGRRRRVSWASLARFGPGGARFQDGREMLQRVERSLIWARGRSVACADSFGGVSGYQRERGRAQYALVRATGWRGRTGGLALLGHVGAHRDGDRAPCACARGSRRGPDAPGDREERPESPGEALRMSASRPPSTVATKGAPRRGAHCFGKIATGRGHVLQSFQSDGFAQESKTSSLEKSDGFAQESERLKSLEKCEVR